MPQVIGSEKSGKSSILEAITKCAIFPRDLRIMTRCPVRFELVGAPKGEPTQTTLTYKKKSMVVDRDEDVNGAIRAVFHGIGGKERRQGRAKWIVPRRSRPCRHCGRR